MIEMLQAIQTLFSVLILPVIAYIIRIEKKLTRLETLMEMMCKKIREKGGEER